MKMPANSFFKPKFGGGVVFTCLIFLSAWFLNNVHGNFISIYLESPTNGETMLLKSEETGTVSVQYTLYGVQQDTQDASRNEFCFEINSVNEGVKTVPFTCMETIHRRVDLANFRPGQYSIMAVLRDKETKDLLDYTRIINSFHVISYVDTLPVIDVSVPAGDIRVAANAQSGVAAIDIPFNVISSRNDASMVDISTFTVCATVEDRATQQVLVPWTCLKNSDRSLSLNQLQRGHSYEVHLRLRDLNNLDKSPRSLIASTEVVRGIIISDVLEVLPTLAVIPSSPREYGVEAGQTVDLQFLYKLTYAVPDVYNVVNQLYVCLNLLYSPTPFTSATTSQTTKTIIEYSCVTAKNDYITLQKMQRGHYRAQLTLSLNQRVPLTTSSINGLDIEVRLMEEFLPSYTWQPLHAWNTIPSGIESRLPVGDSRYAKKEARIPDPWRLQLPLPNRLCKKAYFLRMDVYRTTTIASILQEIAKQCGPHPSHAHKHHHQQLPAITQEESIDHDLTVEDGKNDHKPASAEQIESEDVAQKESTETAAPPLLPTSCFAFVIQSRNNSKDTAVNENVIPDFGNEDNSNVIKVTVTQDEKDQVFEKVFAIPSTSSESSEAESTTVEAIDLFNAMKKEIRWIGQDHPDHCPQFEIM